MQKLLVSNTIHNHLPDHATTSPIILNVNIIAGTGAALDDQLSLLPSHVVGMAAEAPQSNPSPET